MKKRVYIAGKLNDMAVDYNKNRSKMMYTGLMAHKLGFSVFIPCLIEQLALLDGHWEYGDYFDNSQPWLEVCDAILLVKGWKDSPGTLAEIETAKKLNIPIFEDLYTMREYFNSKGEGAKFQVKDKEGKILFEVK